MEQCDKVLVLQTMTSQGLFTRFYVFMNRLFFIYLRLSFTQRYTFSHFKRVFFKMPSKNGRFSKRWVYMICKCNESISIYINQPRLGQTQGAPVSSGAQSEMQWRRGETEQRHQKKSDMQPLQRKPNLPHREQRGVGCWQRDAEGTVRHSFHHFAGEQNSTDNSRTRKL